MKNQKVIHSSPPPKKPMRAPSRNHRVATPTARSKQLPSQQLSLQTCVMPMTYAGQRVCYVRKLYEEPTEEA
jgi:hypothetical protein